LPISGNIISSIETNPFMAAKYLSPFQLEEGTITNPDCEAFKEKGLGRIFKKKEKEKQDTTMVREEAAQDTTVKKRSKVRKFFDNLFKRKKKKK
jgi:hypothetical protein